MGYPFMAAALHAAAFNIALNIQLNISMRAMLLAFLERANDLGHNIFSGWFSHLGWIAHGEAKFEQTI
ncbi:hypothetical protein [Vibrio cholerae]|uniref:hypothetical protein n=1 Tax=Vibrio cholerae TaxID=666 RepID=UPI000A7BAF74|nr:hypothetical protein [Vibrio cholerae]MBJ6974781.1 hypothetical protein [Vibrio cholerae]